LFFGIPGVWTWGFVHAMQVFYHLGQFPKPFLLSLFLG
jgi:hypothetical protein